MPKVEPFENNANRYERWFDKNRWVYASELEAVRQLIPKQGTGIEIGVGTGRFAAPLGIRIGMEPANAMGEIAQSRDVRIISGIAEALPVRQHRFDFALMVTTLCFLDDVNTAFGEAYRILRPGGSLIVGFVDRDSLLGKIYQQIKHENRFYRDAIFYSTDEVFSYMMSAGFVDFASCQTLYHKLEEIKALEAVKEGHDEGSFVVVRGMKKE